MADTKIDEAKNALRRHFVDKRGRPIKTPYFHHQLQVLYEADFFEWVVTAALRELVDEGELVRFDKNNVAGLDSLTIGRRMQFYGSGGALNSPKDRENMVKHIMRAAQLVEKYGAAKNTSTIGKHLESLVKMQLKVSQFEIVGEHTAEYGGRQWSETNHNLDFVARKRNKDFTIGVEVKNTLGCMKPEEIDIKIDICRHLGIVPVFAARWIKPYIECIRRQGGFSWVFKVQMFPLGQEEFVDDIRRRFSTRRGSGRRVDGRAESKRMRDEYPVTVRTELPEKSVAKFDEWVARVEDHPPDADTSHRCTKRTRNHS